MDDPIVIELRGGDEPPDRGADSKRSSMARVLAGAAALLLAVAVVTSVVGDDGGRRDPDGGGEPPSEAHLAAACYESSPSAESLRAVFESIGGFEGLQIGVAKGAFDVVTFDPLDHDRLLAARRTGYGAAENQDVNEQWRVANGELVQSTWEPSTPHDFVHYNADGTITMWTDSGDDAGFAPRSAVIIGRDGDAVTTASSPIHADRFAVDAGTIFALVGDPDWYAPRDTGYRELIADDGVTRMRLAPGADFGWIDVPTPGVLVAYPVDPRGTTAVWDTGTLERLDDHPLAARPYERVAIAGESTTALALTNDGDLEPLDLESGRTGDRFGRLDGTEVDHPVVLSLDGSVAYTVDKSGTVSIWFVGDDTPIATFEASSGLPRWLPTSRSAARVTSVVAPDASRLALRIAARPQVSLSWRLIDTDIESWLARARAVDGLAATDERALC